MRLDQALRDAVRFLEEQRVGSPRMNAEVLLMFILAVDRAYLYAHPERALTAEEHENYQAAVAERAPNDLVLVPRRSSPVVEAVWGTVWDVAVARRGDYALVRAADAAWILPPTSA